MSHFNFGAEAVRAAAQCAGLTSALATNEPGIYSIPAEDYHADPCPVPSLSSSIGKLIIAQSPAHAWTAHPKLNPAYQSEEKTAFDIGSAAHALLLEGEDRMQVIHADSYRTKAAQDERTVARAAGKHPVLASAYQDVRKMAEVAAGAIVLCEELGVGSLRDDGTPEQVIVWREGDVWLRARLDWLSNNYARILDYKTTTDAAPGTFSRHISRMAYHFQAAFYRRGVKAITGKAPTFALVAQETTAPYGVSFHGCAPSLMAIADDQVEMAISAWRACMKSGNWPAYPLAIHYAEAESWQMAEHEERLAGIPYEISKLWSKEEMAR